MIIYIVFGLLICLSIFLDQLTKFLIVNKEVDCVVIRSLIKFEPCWNSGAAFSFLAGKSWSQLFFIILTFITIAILFGIVGYFIYKEIKKKIKPSKWLMVTLALIIGGATGNLIDRMIFHKVRDFIYVFYNTNIFPAVFNVADICLVVGVIMICVYLLFLDKEAVFKKKEKQENNEQNNI